MLIMLDVPKFTMLVELLLTTDCVSWLENSARKNRPVNSSAAIKPNATKM